MFAINTKNNNKPSFRTNFRLKLIVVFNINKLCFNLCDIYLQGLLLILGLHETGRK